MARNDHPAAAAVQAREEVKNRQVAEFYEREANLQPTPTQAEIDLARVGALNHDDKEDDGSEWEADAQARVMQANLAGGPYSTRSLEAGPAGESGEEAAARRRGPGRPRKSESE
jgi:hypothetical protein